MKSLTPGELQATLTDWRKRMSRYVWREFDAGKRTVYVAGVGHVTNDPRPGWLVIDGQPFYSAAWL